MSAATACLDAWSALGSGADGSGAALAPLQPTGGKYAAPYVGAALALAHGMPARGSMLPACASVEAASGGGHPKDTSARSAKIPVCGAAKPTGAHAPPGAAQAACVGGAAACG